MTRQALHKLGLTTMALSALMLIIIGVLISPASTSHPALGNHSSTSKIKGDDLPPRAPNKWFHAERAFPRGDIPRQEWREAQLQARILRDEARQLASSGLRTEAWIPRGPVNVGGRITSLAVDPTNGDIVYAGCAEGGLLRSTNGGTDWTPVFDDQPSLSVGSVAIDPSDPQVIYAGTGEVNPGGGSVAYGGTGVYRSSDGGDTWIPWGLESTGSIGRIIIDVNDSDRIFVAAMGHLWSPNDERGIYRTTDGGDSWQKVHFVAQNTGCVDIIQRPDQPDVLLAAMWRRVRQPEAYDYGGSTCAVWRSNDGGDSWNILGSGLPVPGNDSGRIGLSLCNGTPDRMYAIYADRVGYFDGLYRSNDGGGSWSRTSDGSLGNVFASYGWWFGNVRVHPTDPQTLFVLGLDFYRSTNGGASYSNVGSGMHVDLVARAGRSPEISPPLRSTDWDWMPAIRTPCIWERRTMEPTAHSVGDWMIFNTFTAATGFSHWFTQPTRVGSGPNTNTVGWVIQATGARVFHLLTTEFPARIGLPGTLPTSRIPPILRSGISAPNACISATVTPAGPPSVLI